MSLPKFVIVARHAQSEHHVQGLIGGWTDTPLTALGHEQSKRLAARLKSELGDARITIYTSDLQRALQTAEHVAAAFGVAPGDVVTDKRLREHNNGEAINMTLVAAREKYAGVFDHPWKIDERPFPGAETGRELYERVGGFVDSLRDDGAVPIVVGHGNSIVCIIARWLMLTPEALEPIGFGVATTSITTLTRDRYDLPMVERVNDVGHLAGMEGSLVLEQLLPFA